MSTISSFISLIAISDFFVRGMDSGNMGGLGSLVTFPTLVVEIFMVGFLV
jgi:hypothetical protein